MCLVFLNWCARCSCLQIEPPHEAMTKVNTAAAACPAAGAAAAAAVARKGGAAGHREREEVVDFTKLTVVALKDMLRKKGMKVSGKKAELIERLQQVRLTTTGVLLKQAVGGGRAGEGRQAGRREGGQVTIVSSKLFVVASRPPYCMT